LMPEHQSIRNKLKDREKQHFWFWGVFLETLTRHKSLPHPRSKKQSPKASIKRAVASSIQIFADLDSHFPDPEYLSPLYILAKYNCCTFSFF